jgi:hypothetical protein
MRDISYPTNGREQSEPPDGWGRGTKQSYAGWPDPDSPGSGWNNRRTDADEMRYVFGISEYEDHWASFQHPYPNCLIHTSDGSKWGHPGGTNFLGIGGKGSGKSNFGRFLAIRLMEVNDETIIWRGVSNRSEWTALAPWTTLYLPESVELEPRWMPEDMQQPNGGEPANLTDIVREVRYYTNPVDLNDQLEPATFNVVYPDPEFQDCEAIMQSSDYVGQNVTFTPLSEAGDDEGTSIEHWWFAYFVARLEYGPWDWTSVIFDEVEDFAPESASNQGTTKTYEMVDSLRQVIDQSRKFNLSVFFLGQNEEDLHRKVRRTIQWRVDFPDEDGNRTKDDDPPLGFSDIPMKENTLQKIDEPGSAIVWQPSNFSPLKDIAHIFDPIEFRDRWLRISQPMSSTRARFLDSEPDEQGGGEPADD